MQNTEETKKRIVSLLQTRGPCLPVQISKEIKTSTLFISAFLSELKDEKRIKISNLKVGGSPLYYLEGQETQLENFKQYLHQKEVEALDSLKKNKVLKDLDQEPVMRVALRALKDFSFSFKKDDEVYWRYITTTEQDVKDILEPKNNLEEKKVEEIKIEIKEEQTPPKIEIKETIIEKIEPKIEMITEPVIIEKQEIKIEPPAPIITIAPEPLILQTIEKEEVKVKPKIPKKIKDTKENQETIIPQFNNPLAIKPEPPKPEKIKPKSEFVEKVIEFLDKSKFKIIEEKEYKAKEYNCIVELKTELGPIDFLTLAKEKKSVSDSDLDALLRQAQSIPLPALFIFTGNLSKKALEYEEKYHSVLKTKKIPL